MAPKMRLVVWFKGTNDLRVHDNPLLARAAELCKKTPGGAEVVPAFCFDPRDFGKSDFGSAKVAPHRARFLLESVADLRAQLRRQCGSDLLVSHGSPEMLIGSLVDSAPAGAVVLTSDEVASEELTAIKRVRRAVPKATLECLWMSTVYHRDDLPFALDRLPSAFTPFRDKVERGAQTRAMARTPAAGELPLPTAREELQTPTASFESLPTLEQLGVPAPTDDARGVLRFEGGETAALRRVDHYLFKADCLKTYFETRNGMLGADYSSKLSPWLAHGCLSPLKVLEEIGRYERVRVKNKSTYWLVFELLWRDYFRFFALKEGNAIFQAGGTSGERRTWASGQMAAERLRRWKDGQTGLPLVDANMRELKATGFMSNRGRQNVASYLALDLNLDWRLGADHFQATLVDSRAGASTSSTSSSSPRTTTRTARTCAPGAPSSPRCPPRTCTRRGRCRWTCRRRSACGSATITRGRSPCRPATRATAAAPAAHRWARGRRARAPPPTLAPVAAGRRLAGACSATNL
jgi:deoxyribodipyrimidine photo-lyase